jgi:hypothetical protein
MATTPLIRPLKDVPAPDQLHCQVIAFYHPGYPNLPLFSSTLLQLPRIDSGSVAGSEAVVTGVHHGTALTACQIIANNAFEGYLAIDKDGKEPVDVPFDGLLTRGFYFFFVGNGPSMSPLL